VLGVQYHIRKDISVELSTNQIYKVKRKANVVMIRKTNIGSKVFIKCDCSEDYRQPKFLRMYVRYHAQKVGFLAGGRPIIGLHCHDSNP
jgi:hypothetical protein